MWSGVHPSGAEWEKDAEPTIGFVLLRMPRRSANSESIVKTRKERERKKKGGTALSNQDLMNEDGHRQIDMEHLAICGELQSQAGI